jgi:hypothetical protein
MEKPVFRLDERLYPDDQLISTNTRFWRRIEFNKAVHVRPTLFYRGGLNSIDSVLPLLCIGHVNQAYLLLFQAAEVCLKGVLDEIKSAGLAAWMKQNPSLARTLANNSAKEVLTDIEAMTFIAAFRAASPIVGFSKDLADRASELNRVRNEIAHRGGDSERASYYLGLILGALFPLLDEFFQKVLKLDLADFILHPIARELVVIAKYHRRSQHDDKVVGNCLSHLHSAYFSIWRISEVGVPQYDEDGFSKFDECADDYIQWQDQCHGKLKYDTVANDGYSTDPAQQSRVTYCHICGHECFVTSDWEERVSDAGLSFDVKEVMCPYCRLSIDDPLLAEIHYGRINRESLGNEGWRALLEDLGMEESSSQGSTEE